MSFRFPLGTERVSTGPFQCYMYLQISKHLYALVSLLRSESVQGLTIATNMGPVDSIVAGP